MEVKNKIFQKTKLKYMNGSYLQLQRRELTQLA